MRQQRIRGILVSFITFVAFFPSSGFAEEVRVIKVKGDKAIVKLPGNSSITRGTKLYTQQLETTDLFIDKKKEEGSRKRRLLLSGRRSTRVREEKGSGITVSYDDLTTTSIDFGYAWNQGNFEYGPLFQFIRSETEDETAQEYYLGGFVEYNFMMNKPGVYFVPSAAVYAYYGFLSDDDYLGSSLEGNALDYGAWVGIKYFPGEQDQFAVMVRYIYDRNQSTLDSEGTSVEEGEVTTQGFSFGLTGYF